MLNLFLSILFCDIDWSIVIDIISIIASTILSVIAIVISIKTLKQSNEAIIESSRANIVFYIEKSKYKILHTLVMKNFGNSTGRIISISTTPKIDWSKTKMSDIPTKSITNFNNIFLVPNQSIKSDFDFRDFKTNVINVCLKYETLGKQYIENYNLTLDVTKNITHIEPDTSTIPKGLKAIHDSIQELSEKLL